MDLASERTVDRLSDLWGEGRCGGKGQGGSFRNPLAFEVTAVMSITRFKGYWTGCPRHMLSNSPVRSLGGQEVSWQVVAGDPQLTWVQAPGTAAVGSLMFAIVATDLRMFSAPPPPARFIELQSMHCTIYPFKVCNSMIFSILSDMYNHHHGSFKNIFIISKRNPIAFIPLSP